MASDRHSYLIEDVHWCDDDSMQVLASLAGRSAQRGVTVCMTYRRFEAEQSESIWSVISELESMATSTRVVLSPLNQTETRDLVTAHLGPGVLPARVLDALVNESGGNPLYVLEALRDPDSLLDPDSSAADSPLDPVDGFPASVAKSLRQRIDSLSAPQCARCCGQWRYLGEPCSSQRVSTITGLDRRTTLAALNEAVDRGFLTEIGDGICRYCHDQTRRTVYHSMSDDDIVAWHEQILGALVGEDRSPAEQLAYHADLAGLWDRVGDLAHHGCPLGRVGERVRCCGRALPPSRRSGASSRSERELDRMGELLAYERVLDILGRREDQQALLKRLLDLDPPLEVQGRAGRARSVADGPSRSP